MNRIFAFEGEGKLQQYEGGYLDYLKARARRYPEKYTPDGAVKQSFFGKSSKAVEGSEPPVKENGKAGFDNASDIQAGNGKGKPNLSPKKLKFTYKEQREYETIDEDIASLEKKIEGLDGDIIANSTNSVRLSELMLEKEESEALLEEKMDRWVYLNDLAEQIEAQKQQ